MSARRERTAEDLLRALRARSEMPLTAMVEVSDRCNEVCLHCYQVQGCKGELSTQEWKKVFDELAELGVLILSVSGGESTLRPDIVELLGYARERGFAIRLYTNGLSMGPELASQLASLALLQVDISIYSHRPSVHDWVTGVPGSFERTVNAIRLLVERGVRVEAKLTLMSVNADELEETAAFVEGLGACFSFGDELKPREGGQMDPTALAATREQLARARRFAAQRDSGVPSGSALAPFDTESKICEACNTLHVEPNGELRPCSILEVPLGSAVRDGVRESYERHGRSVRELRWRDVLGCRDCDLRSYCSRCHAVSLAETGDALAPYPSACGDACRSYERVHGEAPVVRGAGGDGGTGPYRAIGEGVYERFRAEMTDADQALRRKLQWVKPPGGRVIGDAAGGGGLVQLRRPSGRVVTSRPDGTQWVDGGT